MRDFDLLYDVERHPGMVEFCEDFWHPLTEWQYWQLVFTGLIWYWVKDPP